jgi:hypothetical protein
MSCFGAVAGDCACLGAQCACTTPALVLHVDHHNPRCCSRTYMQPETPQPAAAAAAAAAVPPVPHLSARCHQSQLCHVCCNVLLTWRECCQGVGLPHTPEAQLHQEAQRGRKLTACVCLVCRGQRGAEVGTGDSGNAVVVDCKGQGGENLLLSALSGGTTFSFTRAGVHVVTTVLVWYGEGNGMRHSEQKQLQQLLLALCAAGPMRSCTWTPPPCMPLAAPEVCSATLMYSRSSSHTCAAVGCSR